MRVLRVHSGNLYGGVETLLATVWRGRAACPTLESEFALCFDGRLRDELREAGATMHALCAARASRPLSVRRARRSLARLLREREFDVAVCHSAWSQALFGSVVREENLPLVFWLHDSVTGKHWLERWAEWTPPAPVVPHSEFTAEAARRLYPRAR